MSVPKLAYTREEAAQACGVSVDTIKKAIARGDLKAKRTSVNEETGDPTGKYLVTVKALEEWLDGLAAA